MNRHIVLAFRMPAADGEGDDEGAYLRRARSLCEHGEGLGGQLVAWSGAVLAMAWDAASIEEALRFATSVAVEDGSNDRPWAVGVAEGELELLAPDGARMHLAWGRALVVAVALARVARGGEALVDGDMRALRDGKLSLLDARTAAEPGIRVRGWMLDVQRPWKREFQPADFDTEELSTAEVLEIVEASASAPVGVPHRAPRRAGKLADRVRRLAAGDKSTDAMEAIADLRRERARAESAGTPSSRCQAALALAMTLSIAGRAEDSLLEALDALARAREAGDPKAIDACAALLAKLYSGAGRPEEASAILRGA